MDRLLMTLGFTESKVDFNIYFKVEGGVRIINPYLATLDVN